MDLDPYIAKLLYDHDCVIIPQFGGFVTNYKRATIDFNGDLASPPSKDIRFNKNLTKSDGLLEKTFADGCNISFEQASANIKTQVNAHWASLQKGESVKFKKIGVLFIDGDKNLRFEAEQGVNYLKHAFGLESFSLPPSLQHLNSHHRVDKEIRLDKNVTSSESKLRSNGIYWVAAATLLPFILWSIFLGFASGFESPTKLNLADLFPAGFYQTAEPAYSTRKSVDNSIHQPPGHSILDSMLHTATTAFAYDFDKDTLDSLGVWIKPTSKESGSDERVAPTDNSGPYHIMGGCFSNHINAEKFRDQLLLEGFKAGILDLHKNLYRVKLHSFQDYELALEELRVLRQGVKYKKAWLLKKPILQRDGPP